MQTIGHGESREMSALDALVVAAESESVTKPDVEINAARPTIARITPDVNGGDPPVSGELLALDDDEIVIKSHHERVGSIAIHFPVTGYRISLESGTS